MSFFSHLKKEDSPFSSPVANFLLLILPFPSLNYLIVPKISTKAGSSMIKTTKKLNQSRLKSKKGY
jgi:hypothetical protein